MIKEVTKNLQATSPTCTRSPLRESMQTGLSVSKVAAAENSTTMATALTTSNPSTVNLTESSHSSFINGEVSVEPKSLKMTFKRNKAPSDTNSIPSASPKQEDSVKSDNGGSVPITIHSDTSFRHTAVNGKVMPPTSLTHSSHGEQTRSTSKRTSTGSSSASKRPKSASKRDRSSSSKTNVLPISSGSPTVVNGRPNSAERSHDPYQFSVKKEEETILPPKKLRLDSSLNRLPDRNESFKDQATNTRNQGTTVDADLLGPCEPGTHVNLDGYVCLETITGMLMVSVVWRGRTYLGTLIDSSTHGFSPPIPPSYVYASQRYCSGIDSSGNSSSNNGNGRNQRGRGKRRCGFAPATSARHSRKGRRNARGSPVSVTSSVSAASHSINPGDDSNEESQSRGESPASENALDDEESIMRYQCPQTGCHKRFKEVKAMKFHHDECHTKKTCDPPSDSESREKRPKATKSANKNKKHATNSSKAVNSQASLVKTEPVSNTGNSENRNSKGSGDGPTVKNESTPSDMSSSFFKTPVNNGLSSPPLLSYSPTSPSALHLPASPANGLKHPGGSGRSCSPETVSLPLHSSSHQMKASPASNSQQQIPPSQPHELPVRIPASNLLVRVGVTSTSGGSSIPISTISSVNSTPAPRTVAAVTVPVTTIPVMKPSTVASSSSVSSASASGGKKVSSKESKSGGGNGKSNSSRSHTSGTVSASTVTVPSVSSPLTSQCQPTGASCSASLKPIQPKPPVAPLSSPSNSCKNSSPSNSSIIDTKRPSNNPSRKRKKSNGTGSDSKRQSLSCSAGGARSSHGKPVQGGKRCSGNSGSGSSEGANAGQGDRASPAYSDISDDNESPIPILEKEGDVKLISDNASGCDEVGKTSEQASGSGGFYNTPPSLVPFSVYSADQSTAPPGTGGTNTGRAIVSGGQCRPASLTKKASSPVNDSMASNVAPQNKANAPALPGTAPVTLASSQSSKKTDTRPKPEFGIGNNPLDTPPVVTSSSVASISSVLSNENEKSEPAKFGSRNDTSHSIEEQLRMKKNTDPPNLTKISSSSSLPALTIPATTTNVTTPASSIPSSTVISQGTVAKPTPLNPLSPTRSSDLPSSTPAVVTPGPLVSGSRASEMYNRPDHLPTPPSFHPAPPGGPFGPSPQFTAHLPSPGALGPQSPFAPYPDTLMRFVHPPTPHGPGHPFSGYPYPAEPFFASTPVSSAPQPHKIHELVEKGVVSATSSSTSNTPGVQTLCTSTSTTASSVANKPVSVETATPMDLQTAKSIADMVAMRHHATLMPNHGGLPQGPTHAGMVPTHFPYSGAIPPAHMAAPPFAALQQHSLPPTHPPTPGPDPFFPPSSLLNHHIYK